MTQVWGQKMVLFMRVLAVVALALAACSEPTHEAVAEAAPAGSAFTSEPKQQWQLPQSLHEISGLAASPDGRLFAHEDERATIYEIDARSGAPVKAFALGDPVETGDFEGVAIAPDGTFWLTDSQGRLFRFREGAAGAQVAFERFNTGLAQVCEVEGLAYLAAEESLILACKRNEARDMRDTLALYAWRTDASGPATLWRRIEEAPVADAAGVRRFRPSSIEIDGERIVLLSANDGAMAEFGLDGTLLAARALGPEHAQAEGVTLLSDGTLVIADEGADGRAMLSLYARAP